MSSGDDEPLSYSNSLYLYPHFAQSTNGYSCYICKRGLFFFLDLGPGAALRQDQDSLSSISHFETKTKIKIKTIIARILENLICCLQVD